MERFVLLFLTFCYSYAGPLQGRKVDCDDPGVFNAVDLALQDLNKAITVGNKYALSVVLDASKTADSDQNYIVKYQLKKTSCLAEEKTPWQNCEFMSSSEGDTGECEAEVHINDSPDLSQISQKCTNVGVPEKVTKMHAGCLGCWQTISNKTLELQPIARHAIQIYNNRSNLSNLFTVGEIVKAQRQVVAGWNYNFEYLARETNCSKAEFPDLTPECKILPEGHTTSCVVDAFVNFQGDLVHMDQKCILREKKNFTVCPGCPHRIPTDSPELKKPLEIVIEKYNSQCGGEYYYKIEKVTEASSQVVAGIIYRVHFEIKPTNCSKKLVPELLDDCQITEDGKELYCYASIYERPWTSEIQTKLKCGPDPQEEKEGKQPLKKQDMLQLMRRPPGFTPFRSANLALITGTNEDELSGVCNLDFARTRFRRRKRSHGHKNGHKKPKRKPKYNSSDESHEDQTSPTEAPEIPEELPTLDPEEVAGRNSNEDFPPPYVFNGAPPSLFDTLPDLPELPAPKCPGKPWKPIVALPTTFPGRDFILEDLLPPAEDTTEPLETASAPNQSPFGDLDLADAL